MFDHFYSTTTMKETHIRFVLDNTMPKLIKGGFFTLVFCALLVPGATAEARYKGEVAGWLPYWQDTMGTQSAEDNLRDLSTIYPFVFEVEYDGTVVDKADLSEDKWQDLFDEADDEDVEVIPTIAWFDGAAMQFVLSDKKRRNDHIDQIVEIVEDGDYDGINIDYEAKLPQTIDHFSTFLKDLKDELGRRTLLTCTVEARTPPEDLYREVPNPLLYANDYEEMAEHCDRVELMTYDQQRADLTLNKKRQGEPYNPVADTDWVEKVVELALEDFDEDQIMLGIATYGREWQITVAPDWYKSYRPQGAINLPDILEIAEEEGVTPGMNAAGETSFTYFPTGYEILNVLPTPKGTRTGFEAAAKALLFANMTEIEIPVNLVWYSDAQAVEKKLELAEKYDLRGVAFFKIDGEEDPDIWKLF